MIAVAGYLSPHSKQNICSSYEYSWALNVLNNKNDIGKNQCFFFFSSLFFSLIFSLKSTLGILNRNFWKTAKQQILQTVSGMAFMALQI